ncbi:MAG: ATP/GTP-binding protein [Thermomicrobiales bacterium]
MALVDIDNRSVVAKIVYYGPAQSGKTTSLRAIYNAVPADQRLDESEFDADGEPTLFFDFVPLDLGDSSGMSITLRLFTVSGQEGKEDARRAVLTGADGIVFVADATAGREGENARSMRELKNVLAGLHPGDPEAVPVVIQYNKLDRADISDPDALAAVFEADDAPVVYASALQHRGPVEALTLIAREVIRRL